MVLCRFYSQGYCKFGNNCRFEHVGGSQVGYGGNYYSNQNYGQQSYGGKHPFTPNQSFTTNNRFGAQPDNRDSRAPKVANTSGGHQETFNDFVLTTIKEVESVEKGKQWPCSCFGLSKSGNNNQNYPGLDDLSPEELRWEGYQNRLQGSMNNYVQGVEQLCKTQQAIRQEIKNRSTSSTDILSKIFHGQTLPQNQVRQTSTFDQSSVTASASNFTFSLAHLNQNPQNQMHIAPPNDSSPFGGQPSNQPKVNSSWPAFAAPTPQSSFNQPTPITNSASIFGGNAQGSKVFTNPAFEPAHPANTFTPFGTDNPGFGGNPANSSVGLAAVTPSPSTQVVTSSKSDGQTYSTLDSLTNEERQQYEAPTFSLGMVPVHPPPKELCF